MNLKEVVPFKSHEEVELAKTILSPCCGVPASHYTMHHKELPGYEMLEPVVISLNCGRCRKFYQVSKDPTKGLRAGPITPETRALSPGPMTKND